MTDIGLRQQTVEIEVFDEQLLLSDRIAENAALVEFDDGGLGQLVVRMRQQMEGLDEQTDRHRGIQAEGLVADDAYIGQLLVEIGGDKGNMLVGANKDGDVMERSTLLLKLSDGVGNGIQRLFLIAVRGQ